jgi:hypothetical protein
LTIAIHYISILFQKFSNPHLIIFQEVGKTDAENDLKTPADKLNDMVKMRQEEKKEDFYKAYAAVIKTAEGKSLLLETYKK